MNAMNIKDIFEEKFSQEKIVLSELDPQFIFLKNFLPERRDSYILDAGCGTGKYSDNLAKMGYLNVFAVDLFDKKFLKDSDFTYCSMSIEKLGFKENIFDFIFCFSVINLVENINDVFSEFHRVLKKNGRLLLSFHTKYSLFTLYRVLFRKNFPHLIGVKFYSNIYYRNLLKKYNFKIIHFDGFRTSFFFYPMYRKLSNYFKLNTPIIPTKVSMNKFLSLIKSEISYHGIIFAEKL